MEDTKKTELGDSKRTTTKSPANAFRRDRRISIFRFGAEVDDDPRLTHLLEREQWMLTIMIPGQRSWINGLRSLLVGFSPFHVWSFLVLAALMYTGTLVICLVRDDDSWCEGGVTSAAGDNNLGFRDYWPTVLNGMATLLLAFYCNLSLSLYSGAYFACQDHKMGVVDLVTLAAGCFDGTVASAEAMGYDNPRHVLIDIWRCANLTHLAIYAMGDKKQNTYSFDKFLVPVSEAFGPWDPSTGDLGMFRDEELAYIRRQLVRSSSKLSNKRGDVASTAAVVHAYYSIKMHRLISMAISCGLTSANWPVWGQALASLRTSGERVKQRALYRMPRVYRDSVKFVVLLAIAVDMFTIATIVGQQIRQGLDYAWFNGIAATSLSAVLLIFALLLIDSAMDMEMPFGSGLLDMPVLSYVTAAAETSGRILDTATAVGELLPHIPALTAPSAGEGKTLGIEGHARRKGGDEALALGTPKALPGSGGDESRGMGMGACDA